MENKKEKIIEQTIKLAVKGKIEQIRIYRNSKYGQFIIQTNEVQFYLTQLILLRTVLCSKKLRKYLEESTFGSLINCFRVCVKNSSELSLSDDMESYNKSRNALAHKMYTKKKLTEADCESSIKLGEKIIAELKFLLKSIYPKEKGK